MTTKPRILLLAHWVHLVLMFGLVLSGLLTLLGLILLLIGNQPRPADLPVRLDSLFRLALTGDGLAILDCGLLLLMLTPGFRVIVLAIGWLWERQWQFAAVALTVTALLAISIFLGMD